MRLGDLYVIDRTDLRIEVFGHDIDEDFAVDMVMYPMMDSPIF